MTGRNKGAFVNIGVKGIMLILFSAGMGYLVALWSIDNAFWAFGGLFSGILIAFLALFFEQNVRKAPLRIIIGGAAGLITTLIIVNLLLYPVLNNFIDSRSTGITIYLVLSSLLGYLGLSVGMKSGDELSIDFFRNTLHINPTLDKGVDIDKVIDTSVIIDGRIADVCETGFVEGALIIPKFVLQELQHIADSADTMRKTRGRRGLDILKRLQNHPVIEVRITDKDYPSTKGVDSKLVELAKEMRAKIITNDANLYKVAELQGVSVLNINELASSLKPVVLPGEIMSIHVAKEGKENDQGIGYLDDGTMVVIDEAKRYIGEVLEVSVTSVLQNPGGRMIFARPREGGNVFHNNKAQSGL